MAAPELVAIRRSLLACGAAYLSLGWEICRFLLQSPKLHYKIAAKIVVSFLFLFYGSHAVPHERFK